MKKSLYLTLAAVLIIGSIGLIKISRIVKQNSLSAGGTNGIATQTSTPKSAITIAVRMKSLTTPEKGDGAFVANLPCFKCHPIDNWQGLEGPESFPHAFHIGMDLHCLNCHTFVAHGEGMKVANQACRTCHG